MYILTQKIKRCRHKIVRWQQEHRSNSKVEIDLLQSELEELRLAGIHGGDIISEIEDKLEKALQNEESYWKDKSRVKWLKSGDQNTAFFHQKFRNRTRRNRIWQLTGNDGEVATSNAGIASVAESYFKDIFSSTCHENPEPLFTDFEPKVTAQMNRRLQRPVTMEEVKRATFSIHPQSAPGDDGMTAKFFQSFWNILSGDVFRAVKSFFSGGRILKGFNHTQICLIPKISDAKDMTQVRPISLSSVFYKIISKVFVHRLQGMMNRLISPTQSAFIKGRLISDNILIAHECMHYLKNKKRGLENEMALKLDMSKAYDRVEWHFLWFILERFGFDSRWIMWIRELVTTVSYSVIVEGQPYGFFKPNRGIRQGDPLSPYLFLFCAEGLSFLLHKTEQNRLIQGLQIHIGDVPRSTTSYLLMIPSYSVRLILKHVQISCIY